MNVRKLIKHLPIVIALLVTVSLSHSADLDKGVEAALSGDFKTALKEFRPLAEQGLADAQFLLGLMYDDGEGVLQDDKEAVKWYRLAAEQGFAMAQSNLGLMYDNGEGVIQDDVYAHMWLNIAASSGNENAKKGREIVSEYMTKEQVAKAQELARACVKKDYKGC